MEKRRKEKKKRNKVHKFLIVFSLIWLLCGLTGTTIYAASSTVTTTRTEGDTESAAPTFGFSITTNGDNEGLAGSVQIILVLTVIALAPSILIMLTSFTRILIVLHFTRAAIGTQTAPPNQILIGLSLFLTFFIMGPVFSEINTKAIQPLSEGTITMEEATKLGIDPLKRFMLAQTADRDLNTMLEIGRMEAEEDAMNYSLPIVVCSFMLSELRAAFIIGFVIYIPFLVIDMVVSSTLMSMGMMMLPPTTISMPFKILLFVLADGWNLIIVNLMNTFIL